MTSRIENIVFTCLTAEMASYWLEAFPDMEPPPDFPAERITDLETEAMRRAAQAIIGVLKLTDASIPSATT